MDDDGQVLVFEVLVEQVAQLRLRPDQVHPDGQRAAGQDCPPDLRLGSFVGTDGVKRDVGEHAESLQIYFAASLTSSTARPL